MICSRSEVVVVTVSKINVMTFLWILTLHKRVLSSVMVTTDETFPRLSNQDSFSNVNVVLPHLALSRFFVAVVKCMEVFR